MSRAGRLRKKPPGPVDPRYQLMTFSGISLITSFPRLFGG